MALLGSAAEQWEHRSCRYNGGSWTYTRGWMVRTTAASDRESVVANASGLPAYGDAHPSPIAAAAYATEISYQMTDRGSTPYAWLVKATYTSDRNVDPDPTNDEVLVSWDSEIYEQPIWEDVNGEAILNSAGDYFVDPTPTRDESDFIARIRSNATSVPAWVLTYNNAVNNATITIGGLSIAAGYAKVQRIAISEKKYRNSTAFYEITFEVHLSRKGWHLKPLDAGFRELSYGNLIQIINEADGQEVTSPVPLDGNGNVLDSPTPTNSVFLDFTIYEEKDLTVLPGIS